LTTKNSPNEKKRSFNPENFLVTQRVKRKVVEYATKQVIYCQGAVADRVMYIQKGAVRLSVVNLGGKEAVFATLGQGDFFGEGCMAGQPVRMATAIATKPTTIFAIDKSEMGRVLRLEHSLSDQFIKYLLTYNIKLENDLVDQLFNSSEKRLARTLLLLAGYGTEDDSDMVLPRVSQGTLAEMVGTTRPRVNFFMNKFRKLGYIEYKGRIKVKKSLLTAVLGP
jgi:CRP-like cAMP-binding protein